MWSYLINFILYHSWAIASCAVSRWSWSTSIKDATKFLAGIQNKNSELLSPLQNSDLKHIINTLIKSYQNLKCHPNMANQIHSPLTKSLGKDSYHDHRLHQHRCRKEGSQTNYWVSRMRALYTEVSLTLGRDRREMSMKWLMLYPSLIKAWFKNVLDSSLKKEISFICTIIRYMEVPKYIYK